MIIYIYIYIYIYLKTCDIDKQNAPKQNKTTSTTKPNK